MALIKSKLHLLNIFSFTLAMPVCISSETLKNSIPEEISDGIQLLERRYALCRRDQTDEVVVGEIPK